MLKFFIKVCFTGCMAFCLSACTNMWHDLSENMAGRPGTRNGVSSSLVDYLYPKGEVPPKHDDQIPNLKLPLKIGLAFVPSKSENVQGLSEADKTKLLENVKTAFDGMDFIREIMIIPDTYMRSASGFEGVDQIGRLYGLDVMALVSYDQVAHVDDTKASILYWTIVGAYFVKGSKNDVQTFVDTAIFDISSRKLLFRAPGVNKIEATATLVDSTEKMRTSREESFQLAMADMTQNLVRELGAFKERIKKDNVAVVTHKEGYGGSGGIGFSGLFVLAIGAAFKFRNRIKEKNA